ncbi:MAG: hypothetical protein ABI947_18390 [Chloroflexota bacterium]
MANDKREKTGNKHNFILYRFMARRYRPPGVLLVVMGIVALLPTFVPQLRFQTAFLNYQQLAIIGGASILVGLVLYIGAVLAERRAFVQCLPDYILISTMFQRVYVSYQRINSVQPVQVGRVFDIKSIKKEREQKLIKPLLAEPAVELVLSSFPLPESQLRKAFTQFLFSTRNIGFIFIVPKPSALSNEISTFMQRAADERDADQQRYLDPIERLKYQEGKTF